MKKFDWDGLGLALRPVLDRVGPRSLEANRTISLSGAGVATAMVLLLAQLKNAQGASPLPTSLAIAIWCAAVALPCWLGYWQIFEAYIFWGKRAQSHYERPKVIVCLLLLYLGKCALLVVGMIAIVWYFLPSAAVGMIVASLLVTVAVCWFVQQIRRSASGS